MNTSIFRWGTALIAALAIAGCGGGGGGTAATTTTPVTGTAVNTAITTAAAVLANDTATNTSSAFTVLQTAGVPAVTINSPPVINFTVFSGGAIVKDISLDTKQPNNVRVAIAKLVRTAGEPDEWVSYVTRMKTATTGKKLTSMQATTDTGGTLTYNKDGYYTYTFGTDVKLAQNANGDLVYDDTRAHRVVLQLSYKDANNTSIKANPYFDFTLVKDAAGKATSVVATPAQTRKMADINSCNSCHDKLTFHGGGRVDTQYCVMCHNPGTTDPVSGNVVTLSTMVHKIHAGKRLAAAGDPFYIGLQGGSHDYSEVGFPQDLRNCAKCHTAGDPTNAIATPQGDNWKTVVSKQACLTCHSSKPTATVPPGKTNWYTSHTDIAHLEISSTATANDLTNAQCLACHKAGTDISSEQVHWNQNEENAAKYKMNIVSATYSAAAVGDVTKKGTVTVRYSLVDPTNNNVAYDLASDATKFGSLRLYVAYQNMDGLTTGVTEFTAANNGDNGYVAANSGTNIGGNVYERTIDVKSLTARGTGRIVSIGQIKELALNVKTRLPIDGTTTVSTLAQNTYADFVISGTTAMPARRQVVSNDKCNACHGSLGATSGANTLANAFHGGARNTVEACVICHDANRASSGNMMTDGSANYESYQFKRMIHGIHGNSKRVYPFTHGNKTVGKFDKTGKLLTTGTLLNGITLGYGGSAFDVPLTDLNTVLPFAIDETFETIDVLINGVATVTSGYQGSSRQSTENYAAEVAYPQQGSTVAFNCNACHVNDSYKTDQSNLGTVVMKPTTSAGGVTPVVLETDANKWLVISPQAASCTSCHDGVTKTTGLLVSTHIAQSVAKGSFGTLTQAGLKTVLGEGCMDCHAPGASKGVDVVHGQQ